MEGVRLELKDCRSDSGKTSPNHWFIHSPHPPDSNPPALSQSVSIFQLCEGKACLEAEHMCII